MEDREHKGLLFENGTMSQAALQRNKHGAAGRKKRETHLILKVRDLRIRNTERVRSRLVHLSPGEIYPSAPL